jgi:hypothetical protein
MRQRVATLAAVSALALALSASPALASPVTVVSIPWNYPGAFPPVVCSHHTYTLTSGDFLYVTRDPSSAAHVTARNAWATDEGLKPYHVVGAETYNDPDGRFTSKLMFVSQGGGIADSVNIVFRASPNGNGFFFDRGTCAF